MKPLPTLLAAALVAGCASADMAEIGRVVQQATDTTPAAAPVPGGNTSPGSVASGGTGYLPCALGPAARTVVRPDCK